MKQRIKIILIIVLISFYSIGNNASAAIIFENNFDSIADWNLNGDLNSDCGSWSGGANQCSSVASGFSNYYTPGTGGYIAAMPNGLADHTGGAAKKAWVAIYPNLVYTGGSELSKTLDSDYPELYVRYWARTSPGWVEATAGSTSSTTSIKMSRIIHFDRSGSAFQYFSGGNGGPMAGWNLARNDAALNGSYGNVCNASNGSCAGGIAWYRGDPQATYYDAVTGSYTDNIFHAYWTARNTDYPCYVSNQLSYNGSGGYADGSWHRWDFHVKMNDLGQSNGIYEIWYDGNLIRSDQAVQWAISGSDGISGWNTVQLGGNADNPGNSGWIAFDDLVVSTTPIDANYVIGQNTTYSLSDFVSLISNWQKFTTVSDLNGDNVVNSQDLGIMMSKWQ